MAGSETHRRGAGLLRALAASAIGAVAMFAGAGGAQAAATPHKLGDGEDVRVALSPDGAAHFVWAASFGDDRHYTYCRVPPGATSCDRTHELTGPAGNQITQPPGVFALSNSRIVVVEYWCCATNDSWIVESNDGGRTFGPRGLLADGSQPVSSLGGEAVFGPGNAITTVQGSGPKVQSSPLGSVTSASTADLDPNGGSWEASIGFADARGVVAWSSVNDARIRYRVSNGGNLNQNAGWGPIKVADPSSDTSVELASGPSGLFLLYSRTTEGPVVRKWNGSGFGPATKLATDGIFGELFEDPSGRLYAAWTKAAPFEPRGPLMYSESPDGSSWSKPAVLVEDVDPDNIQLAASASGQGVVAYNGGRVGAPVTFARLEPPPPAPGKTANVEPVKGTVKTKCKGDRRFTRLTDAEQIPVGCKVDTRRGKVKLTSSKGTGGGTQSGTFNGAVFKLTQKKAKHPYTELKLAGSLHCNKKALGASSAALGAREAKGKKKHGRKLWGNGKGKFRTRGRHGSASVRGTNWLVADRCDDSTLFKVRRGKVKVRDFVKHKTVTLRKGQTYVAKKRGRR